MHCSWGLFLNYLKSFKNITHPPLMLPYDPRLSSGSGLGMVLFSYLVDQKDVRYWPCHRGKAIHQSSVLPSKGFLMKSIKPMRFCSRRKHLASTICCFPSITTNAKAKWWRPHKLKMEFEKDDNNNWRASRTLIAWLNRIKFYFSLRTFMTILILVQT